MMLSQRSLDAVSGGLFNEFTGLRIDTANVLSCFIKYFDIPMQVVPSVESPAFP